MDAYSNTVDKETRYKRKANRVVEILDKTKKPLKGKKLLECLDDSEFYFDFLPEKYKGILIDTLKDKCNENFFRDDKEFVEGLSINKSNRLAHININLYRIIQSYLPYFICTLGLSSYKDNNNYTSSMMYYNKKQCEHAMDYYWEFTKGYEEYILEDKYLAPFFVEKLILTKDPRGKKLLENLSKEKIESYYSCFNFDNFNQSYMIELISKEELDKEDYLALDFLMTSREIDLETACKNLKNVLIIQNKTNRRFKISKRVNPIGKDESVYLKISENILNYINTEKEFTYDLAIIVNLFIVEMEEYCVLNNINGIYISSVETCKNILHSFLRNLNKNEYVRKEILSNLYMYKPKFSCFDANLCNLRRIVTGETELVTDSFFVLFTYLYLYRISRRVQEEDFTNLIDEIEDEDIKYGFLNGLLHMIIINSNDPDWCEARLFAGETFFREQETLEYDNLALIGINDEIKRKVLLDFLLPVAQCHYDVLVRNENCLTNRKLFLKAMPENDKLGAYCYAYREGDNSFHSKRDCNLLKAVDEILLNPCMEKKERIDLLCKFLVYFRNYDLNEISISPYITLDTFLTSLTYDNLKTLLTTTYSLNGKDRMNNFNFNYNEPDIKKFLSLYNKGNITIYQYNMIAEKFDELIMSWYAYEKYQYSSYAHFTFEWSYDLKVIESIINFFSEPFKAKDGKVKGYFSTGKFYELLKCFISNFKLLVKNNESHQLKLFADDIERFPFGLNDFKVLREKTRDIFYVNILLRNTVKMIDAFNSNDVKTLDEMFETRKLSFPSIKNYRGNKNTLPSDVIYEETFENIKYLYDDEVTVSGYYYEFFRAYETVVKAYWNKRSKTIELFRNETFLKYYKDLILDDFTDLVFNICKYDKVIKRYILNNTDEMPNDIKAIIDYLVSLNITHTKKNLTLTENLAKFSDLLIDVYKRLYIYCKESYSGERDEDIMKKFSYLYRIYNLLRTLYSEEELVKLIGKNNSIYHKFESKELCHVINVISSDFIRVYYPASKEISVEKTIKKCNVTTSSRYDTGSYPDETKTFLRRVKQFLFDDQNKDPSTLRIDYNRVYIPLLFELEYLNSYERIPIGAIALNELKDFSKFGTSYIKNIVEEISDKLTMLITKGIYIVLSTHKKLPDNYFENEVETLKKYIRMPFEENGNREYIMDEDDISFLYVNTLLDGPSIKL